MSAPTDEKPQSKLQEMATRGDKFREDFTLEMFGEEVVVVLAPLKDKKFLPVAGFLKEHLGMDEDEAVEAVEEAKSEAEEEGEDTVDVSKMDLEFVAAMQRAAVAGIRGSYSEDGEFVEHDEEEAQVIVDKMVGGFSVEIGGKVLEVSGDVRDATKFRGVRGSI